MEAPLTTRGRLAQVAPFLPAAGLLFVWVVWVPNDGGYFARDWYPAALFLVALAAAVAIAGDRLLPRSRTARVALGLLAAGTAWSFVSLIWSETPGSGWAESDQLLLYLATAWLVALVPWRPVPAMGLLGLWSLGVAVVCLIELVSALGADRLGHYILESRWQQPTGYANAAAALATMAAFPPLAIAARRGTPLALQAPMLALATFLAEFSMLPQSRGALIAAIPGLLVLVALAGDRWRLLARLGVMAVVIAVAGDAVWDVYSAGEDGRPVGPALDRAAEAMLWSAGAAAAGALLVGLAERRIAPMARTGAVARRGAFGLAAVVAVVAVGVAAANAGAVRDYVHDSWEDFSAKEDQPEESGARIGRVTSDKRYDYWRVSVAAFRDAPVGGLGAGGFEREYAKERVYEKPSLTAHSIWMRALAETGIVGAGLLAALVGVLGVGLVVAARRLGAAGRTVMAACGAVSAYFVAHASLDWLDVLPALAAPAVALPFLALELRDRDGPGEDSRPDPPGEPARGPGRKVLAIAAVAVTAVLALAVLALPYLSVRYTESGEARAGSDATAADADLRRAAALNPLSSDPRIAQGVIAIARGRFPAARLAFARALEAEDVWYPHFELALLHSHAGRFGPAGREIARARMLNRQDHFVEQVAEAIAKRQRLDPRKVRRSQTTVPLDNNHP